MKDGLTTIKLAAIGLLASLGCARPRRSLAFTFFRNSGETFRPVRAFSSVTVGVYAAEPLQRGEPMETSPSLRSNGRDLKSLLRAYERQIIQSALAASSGNQRRAARVLGLLPTTLHEKMKRLGLTRRERQGQDAGAAGNELQGAR